MIDRAVLHAKSTLIACGLTRTQVQAARLDGNDVVVTCMRSETPHEFSICFPNPDMAQRGHDAVIAFKAGPKPAL